MCWVYLRTTKKIQPVSTDYLRRFFTKGGDKNADGWGVSSYIYKDKNFSLMKEPSNAARSLVAHAVAVASGLPKSKAVIGHLRNMSTGRLGYRDTQPYVRPSAKTGKMWAFSHNGHMLKAEMEELDIDIKENTQYSLMARTDSEKLFIEFLDCLDRIMKSGDESKGLFDTIHEFLNSLNDYGKMCMALTDGKISFAYRDLKARKNLYWKKDDAGYIVCTSRLTNDGWTAFIPGQLLVFKRGVLIYDSKPTIRVPVSTFPPVSKEPVWDFIDHPESDFLMGRDNFEDACEDVMSFEELDKETYSSDRKHYGELDILAENGHDFTIT